MVFAHNNIRRPKSNVNQRFQPKHTESYSTKKTDVLLGNNVELIN